MNKLNCTAEPSVIEIPLDGQLKVEVKSIPCEAKGHACLVLVIFIDKPAALGEVGFVVEAGIAAGMSPVKGRRFD